MSMGDHDAGEGPSIPGQHPRMRGDAGINALLARIVLTMAEMELGHLPVGTLDTLASPLAARRIRHLVHCERRAPGGGRRRGGRTVPLRIRTASSFHPSAGVTEGVVVIASESRTWAYCVRLEREGERWRLVELARPDGGLRPAITEASRTGALPVDEHGVHRSSGRDGIAFAAAPLPERPGEHPGGGRPPGLHGTAADGGDRPDVGEQPRARGGEGETAEDQPTDGA
jgi:hypothetical protein